MTSARSPEQRARLSRESGLDLNRFDSVTHLVGSLGTRPNARLPEYGILSESLQSSSLPIYQFTTLPIAHRGGRSRALGYSARWEAVSRIFEHDLKRERVVYEGYLRNATVLYGYKLAET